MISAVLIAGALLFQAAPAADPAAPPASKVVSPVTVTGKTQQPPADDSKTIVCHDEKVLGTLFPKQVCARKEDISARRREDQAETRRNTALRPWRDPAG